VLVTAGRRGTSSASRVFEVAASDGQVVWELRLPPDFGVYRAGRITPPLVRAIGTFGGSLANKVGSVLTPATGTEIAIDKNTTDAQLTDMLDVTDSLLSSLTTTAASIGVMKTRIDDQMDYTADLSDSIDKSVGALVDTDMDEASIRQKAIETQKQMAVEAISILNTASSKILILLE